MFVTAGYPVAGWDGSIVTLDGLPVERWFAADDVDGWVMCWGDDPHTEKILLRGKVEFSFVDAPIAATQTLAEYADWEITRELVIKVDKARMRSWVALETEQSLILVIERK